MKALSVFLLLTSMGPSTVLVNPHGTNTAEQRSNQTTTVEQQCRPRDYSRRSAEWLAQMDTAAQTVISNGFIYIDGARHKLDKSNFTRIYHVGSGNDCDWGGIGPVGILEGFEVTVPVDGDGGQDLYFDINGRSNQHMELSISCGSFDASDSGTKWAISREQKTDGSCRSMHVKVMFPSPGTWFDESSFELSMIISTGF
ncbi:hypothetical protein BB427_03240 [Pseudoalteromonas sp. BMB]|uniref:hypothetical protein n=1 Tax=Pseudoalteromonas sp. BMB TaxID=1874619 RepID=UPI00083CC86D|nr:hypothetical protein [Pseudoalteromonas sp. BMB]ODB35628.1 hypothetical protein BB427_03240 [Pseudoalteromonas sp. BMB]